MSFHVGQKVVCVDASRGPTGHTLVEQEIYTVSALIPHEFLPSGIQLADCPTSNPNGYRRSRFRPLVERSTETGMAILRKVADDASKKRNLVTTR